MVKWGRVRMPLALLVALVALVAPVGAQERPRYGGELLFAVPSESPSYDGHQEETFGLIHPVAPHYNTLLRIDPFDKSGTQVVPDLAESWTVSKDGRTYTFRVRTGVKFHDGSELTARDVKASYDKIVFPPASIASRRKGAYANVEAIEAPNPTTVVFRLKWPQGSFVSSLASPWNWIYKADILARDMRWYETNVMGTGPFAFVEHVKGSHWVGKKNPNYWDKGKPYLDGYRAIFIRDSAAQVSAIRAERAHIQFRGFSPAERDTLVAALGTKVTVQDSPWDCMLYATINHEKKPFNDKRVRRALTLAVDRYEGSQAISKIAIVRTVAGVQVPGSPFATLPGDLEKLAGYGHDINKSRAEARRLLKEAGVPDGFSFTFKNRSVPMPYEPRAIWRSWPATGTTSTSRAPRPGVCSRKPACPTGSRSPSRTGPCRCPTSRWASGSSTSGGGWDSTSSRRCRKARRGSPTSAAATSRSPWTASAGTWWSPTSTSTSS